MDLYQTRCEDKPSPACEHNIYIYIYIYIVPTSRAELLIRTIAETNMALWTFGRPGQLWQRPWFSLIRQAACGDEHFRENCNVH